MWIKALEVPADKTAASVTGLSEGQEYQFRIKAKNKAGPGEPSDPSAGVVTKPRHRKSSLCI